MRAISLTQPWATLMAYGAKRWETRSWPTKYRGPLVIHAARAFPKEARQLCMTEPFLSVLSDYGYHLERDKIDGVPALEHRCGHALAIVTLTDCIESEVANLAFNYDPDWIDDRARWNPAEHEQAFGDYGPDRYAFTTTFVQRFPDPIPVRGALSLWRLPLAIEAQVQAIIS